MRTKIIQPEVLEQLLSETFTTRFWSNVDVKGPDECWLWKLYIKDNGYGQASLGGKRSPWRSLYSHRIAWMIANRSDVPDGLKILHSCISNRACCNPAHLRPGTQLDNMRDMKAQGHYGNNKGEKSGNHKLTNTQVEAIRLAHSLGGTQVGLAVEYGVCSGTIYQVIHRNSWNHIA